MPVIIQHEGPRIISESSGFKCIQLISQVIAERPFLNDNFGCLTNSDMLFLVMRLISLVDEIQFMLISNHHIYIRSIESGHLSFKEQVLVPRSIITFLFSFVSLLFFSLLFSRSKQTDNLTEPLSNPDNFCF